MRRLATSARTCRSDVLRRRMCSDERSGVTLLFPGQGSQHVGMAKDIVEEFAEARHVMNEVDEALQFRLSQLMFEGSPDDLRNTAVAQPAILAHGIVVLRVLQRELSITVASLADMGMGHSLGEFTALTAAGVLDLAQAVRIVRARGEAMQRAVAAQEATAMVALVGRTSAANPEDSFAAHVRRAAATAEEVGGCCQVANVNSARQARGLHRAETALIYLGPCPEHAERRVPSCVSRRWLSVGTAARWMRASPRSSRPGTSLGRSSCKCRHRSTAGM